MKKQIFGIKIHSTVPVITNSSTELFGCNTDKDIESVKKILQKIIDGYNMMNDSSYGMDMFEEPFLFKAEEYRKWKKEDDKKRKKAKESGNWDEYYKSQPEFSMLGGWFDDPKDKKELEKIIKSIIESGRRVSLFGCFTTSDNDEYGERIQKAARDNKEDKYDFEAARKEVDKIYNELKSKKKKPDWWDEPWKHSPHGMGTTVDELDGQIIIVGSSDNSIPYDIWPIINSKLNANNYHLG